MSTNDQQAAIAAEPQPMWARPEIVRYAPSAVVAWTNEAATRAVTLLEHDSIIVGVLALRDFIAKPSVTGAPSLRGTLAVAPYATIPVYDPAAKKWDRVPVVGIYERPNDALAARWYDALTALAWRIADKTKAEPAPSAQAQTSADSIRVALFGENKQLTITTPGLQFREDAETVRAAPVVIAGAMAVAEQLGRAARGITTALSSAETDSIARGEPLAVQLAKERAAVSARGNWRALGTAAVVLGAAYGYSRM